MSDEQVGRVPSTRKLRRLGPINWALAKGAARTTRALSSSGMRIVVVDMGVSGNASAM